MNRILLSAAALTAASALAFVPTYAQSSDDQQDENASDSSSTPIDLDKIHGPVYVIQDPATGQTYILVPKTDENEDDASASGGAPASAGVTPRTRVTPTMPGVSPVRGVTYWA